MKPNYSGFFAAIFTAAAGAYGTAKGLGCTETASLKVAGVAAIGSLVGFIFPPLKPKTDAIALAIEKDIESQK